MYRFIYRNKVSGASVFSHKEIQRDDLVLVRKFEDKEMPKRNTQMTESDMMKKSEVFVKPKVITIKRK
jgi:hypothetical protein